ncbi:MAG: terpene cyclase/mutase family protein, partial [Planctomycetota bacterium]|nr:terpene cyclase/mutase family protein [Planctomycetota bacterium]
MSRDEFLTIETTLPKSWEQEETFNDVLYDWMGRAPWLAISAALHVVAFLVIAAIPWNLFDQPEEKILKTPIAQALPPDFIDPPDEEEVELPEDESEEEPIIQDFEVADVNQTDSDEEFESSEGAEGFADSPFDNVSLNNVIGIGGPPGGKFGRRFGGNRNSRTGGPRANLALSDGLEWLKNHQDADGKWDADGFMRHDPSGDPSGGAGDAKHDVGLTGLALLAFLGNGNTSAHGPHKQVVNDGIKWLREQQDVETGLIGDPIGHSFLYDHSIATLAICEAYYFTKSPLLKPTAQRAINYITRARNPYGAWRYDVPPVGDNDTSVTGWMIFALKSAEEAGLTIDRDAYNGALQWFDEVTDPATGRVGYDSMGSLSGRVTGVNDHFPPEKGEAMTAVGLLSRVFLGQTPEDTPVMLQHADLMLKNLPEWDPDGLGNDMYYWYYGSYAMFQ